jgi:H+/gluconate symporter-like permease
MTVADRNQSGPAPVPRDGLFDDPRAVSAIACIVALIVILVGGHLYGRYLAAKDLGGRDNAIEQLQAESQQQKRNIDQKSLQLTDLQVRLDKTKAQLEAILPAKNTYNIMPNQTLIVADGRVTVGLIGSPANESIMLNVNGKQQVATVGQVIATGSDPSANCQVAVQSFDMFKAVLTASCAGAKGQ